MSTADLAAFYRDYVACLNRRDWQRLGSFVHEDVLYNDGPMGLKGYRAMLEGDVAAIPDLSFEIEMLVAEPPHIASRLRFDCRPAGDLFGFPVNGKRVSFTENVLYEVLDGRIRQVWSVIDKLAIKDQL